ncbi:MAG: Zn-ribbon domain-containing OB-fold protein [Marmoricola sp.]
MGRSLTGSRCLHCGTVAFPAGNGCQRCGLRTTETLALTGRGTVWGFTVQRFAPKSPPYVVPPDGFVPFAVGYVELPEGVKVEAVLECTDFAELEGAAVTLVGTDPVPRFATDQVLVGKAGVPA